METPTITKTPENWPEIERLSVDHAAMLIFLSFRFSQGSGGTQDAILEWLHLAFPSYRLSQENIENVSNKIVEMSKKYILNNLKRHTTNNDPGGRPVTEDYIKKEVSDYVNSFFVTLEGGVDNHLTRQQSLEKILTRIIERDYYYLIGQKGRPNGGMDSQFVTYGIQRKPTGLAEYDQMFRDMYNLVESERETHDHSGNTQVPYEKIKKIINAHQDVKR